MVRVVQTTVPTNCLVEAMVLAPLTKHIVLRGGGAQVMNNTATLDGIRFPFPCWSSPGSSTYLISIHFAGRQTGPENKSPGNPPRNFLC